MVVTRCGRTMTGFVGRRQRSAVVVRKLRSTCFYSVEWQDGVVHHLAIHLALPCQRVMNDSTPKLTMMTKELQQPDAGFPPMTLVWWFRVSKYLALEQKVPLHWISETLEEILNDRCARTFFPGEIPSKEYPPRVPAGKPIAEPEKINMRVYL